MTSKCIDIGRAIDHFPFAVDGVLLILLIGRPLPLTSGGLDPGGAQTVLPLAGPAPLYSVSHLLMTS